MATATKPVRPKHSDEGLTRATGPKARLVDDAENGVRGHLDHEVHPLPLSLVSASRMRWPKSSLSLIPR